MEIQTDFLVLGSGIAGLTFAIKAAQLGTVAIVTKKEKTESNTNYAQGGIAAVHDKNDRFEYHIQDTLLCGSGLCKEDVVKFVISEGPERIKELVDWGVRFSRARSGDDSFFDLGKEGGHSMRRVLHSKDLTGKEIERALNEKANTIKNINFYENHIAVDLIMRCDATDRRQGSNMCLGAYVLDILADEIYAFKAKFTIIATGGVGKVYLITTNPDIATGDGIAMAYRAGAVIANMEFIQFHPTCLYHPKAKSFLISEAVRGEGGVLKLKDGTPFMMKYHPMESLAPRDIVAQAIDNELKRTGDRYVLLDVTHKEKDFIMRRFPNIYQQCLEFGIDMTKEPIPVVPAAHYLCGGVVVNHFGQTSIPRLFACGEASCTGLHGANRLASNSLLEAVVFAHRAYLKVAEEFGRIKEEQFVILPWEVGNVKESNETIIVSHNWEEIRRGMWHYVGIVRSSKRLERAGQRLELICREIDDYYRNFLITRDLVELRNIAVIAKLIVRCAMMRKESRGLHYNVDYPQRNDIEWVKDSIVSLSDDF